MKALQRLILATLLCMAALHTQAAPFFASKDGSMVWDKETKLVWMRCNLGEQFNGTTCQGIRLNEADLEKTLTGDRAYFKNIRSIHAYIDALNASG